MYKRGMIRLAAYGLILAGMRNSDGACRSAVDEFGVVQSN